MREPDGERVGIVSRAGKGTMLVSGCFRRGNTERWRVHYRARSLSRALVTALRTVMEEIRVLEFGGRATRRGDR